MGCHSHLLDAACLLPSLRDNTKDICSHHHSLARFLKQKIPSSTLTCSLPEANRRHRFTLKPQRISGHIQTTEGHPGVVPYKKTILSFRTLPSALESSPGILFLFDSLKKNHKKKKKHHTPKTKTTPQQMEGRRERNVSQ